MMADRIVKIPVGCILLTSWLVASPVVDATELSDAMTTAVVDCSEPQQAQLPYQFDYRSRDSTAPSPIGTSAQWNYQDNWSNHTGPAISRLQSGDYSRQVMADLNFTFLRWPNHMLALLALTKYFKGGGQQYEYLSAECYFQRATKFAPDDPDVLVVIGVYFYQSGRMGAAKEAFEGALQLNPQLLDAHYNLGLVYVQLKDLTKAKECALAAYSGGYPLPGLRQKLQQLGVW